MSQKPVGNSLLVIASWYKAPSTRCNNQLARCEQSNQIRNLLNACSTLQVDFYQVERGLRGGRTPKNTQLACEDEKGRSVNEGVWIEDAKVTMWGQAVLAVKLSIACRTNIQASFYVNRDGNSRSDSWGVPIIKRIVKGQISDNVHTPTPPRGGQF